MQIPIVVIERHDGSWRETWYVMIKKLPNFGSMHRMSYTDQSGQKWLACYKSVHKERAISEVKLRIEHESVIIVCITHPYWAKTQHYDSFYIWSK
jgi:hypothetical protein